MAEISKLSGVAIADVAKVDAVLKANIANINDLTIPSGVAPPLDTYTGAAAAYSVRLLLTAYTGACMRVREDSGDTETDIGFDSNGDLDTAAIATHCGSANGYVTKWYGQESSGGTGSGNDAAQTTNANQPQIYNGTAVITENGKPALDFDGSNDTLNIGYTTTFTNISIWSVHAGTDGAVMSSYPGSSPRNFLAQDMTSNAYRSIIRNAAATLRQISTGTTSDTQVLQHLHYDRTNLGVAVDGGTLQTTAASLGDIDIASSGINIGNVPAGTNGINGTIQEVLLYNSDEASNRTGIETNVNNYFSVF